MGSVVVLSLFLAILIAAALVPVLIGVYVYKDAKKRGMNEILWMAVAVIAPMFIGLILYLFLREEKTIFSCSNCGAQVHEGYSVCPNCATPLRNNCPKCGLAVESGWKVCPHCANSFPDGFAPAKKEKAGAKGLKWVIICIIIIPFLLCALLIFGFMMFRENPEATTVPLSFATQVITKEEVQKTAPEVYNWIENCDKQTDQSIFVLSDDNNQMVVYTKGWFDKKEIIDFEISSGFWRKETQLLARLPMPRSSDSDHYNIQLVSFEEGGKDLNIEFYCGDQKINAVETKTSKLGGLELMSNQRESEELFYRLGTAQLV